MAIMPSAAYSLKITVRIPNRAGNFAKIAGAIASVGGDLNSVTILSETRDELVREITAYGRDLKHEQEIAAAVCRIPEIKIISIHDRTFDLHNGGKLSVVGKTPLTGPAELSMAYTPGVARVCMAIADDKHMAQRLTIKRNTVAVVSDGTAVLGLGDIGPEAAMPVMEGKAQLFKEFGGVDAFPICIATKDVEEIIKLVKLLAPTFGGVNLEDISAPRCFEIEERLKAELDMPIFHDDQHGTAIVALAALINALKIVGKKIEDICIVVCGVGAAGVACSKIFMNAGAKNVVGVDTSGAIYKGRTENMNPVKQWYADHTNPENRKGTIHDVIKGADVFVGLSKPGQITVLDVENMAKDPIVFAMSNPVPEIMPEEAAPHVAIMATGRSDYPNQINNVLAFPGLFRGALDVHATKITEGMKVAAALAIANLVGSEARANYIIPSPFDRRVAPAVAEAVRQAAIAEGVARLNDPADAEITLATIKR